MFEMKCLRSIEDVTRMDEVKNEVIRNIMGVNRELAGRVDCNIL